MRFLGRAPRALAELLHRLEQGPDHVAARRVHQDLHEVARFDLERGVDVDEQTFIDRGHDEALRGVIVIGLLAQHGVADGKDRRAGCRERATAGNAEIFLVPRLLRAGIGFDPGLRGGEKLARRHDFLRQAHAHRGRAVDAPRLKHHGERLHGAHHARQALCAARARNEAHLGFGEAEANARIVGNHPAMAGERDLQAPAQRGAVDGRHHGLSAELDFAEGAMDIHHGFEGGLRRIRATLAGIGAHLVKVGAGAEGARFAAGQDKALDACVFGDGFGDLRELGNRRHGKHIHGLIGLVPDQRDDSVRILIPLEIDEFHVDLRLSR